MKFTALLPLALAAASCVAAHNNRDPFEQWQAPKGGDVRGPCPFLNTFANHGFLPRTGKYITERDLTEALFNSVHFGRDLGAFLFSFARSTNPEPNATWFSLDHLTRHNVLEHDASLSRVDAFHGHADIFNHQAFDETRSYYGARVDAKAGAAAIVARMRTCESTNPQYSLSNLGEAFIIGETAAFISILGDPETLTADKRRVEYLFQKERLPTELGWKRSDTPFTRETLETVMGKIEVEYRARLNSTTTSRVMRKRAAGSAFDLIRNAGLVLSQS